MNITANTTLSDAGKEQVLLLWNNEYPAHINYNSISDFNKYLNGLTHKAHHLLIDDSGKIRGWLFVFERDNEDWFALLIDSEIQGMGYGAQMLNVAKEHFAVLNGWAIDHNDYHRVNGDSYKSPLGFYLKNGFAVDVNHKFPSDLLSAVKIAWHRL